MTDTGDRGGYGYDPYYQQPPQPEQQSQPYQDPYTGQWVYPQVPRQQQPPQQQPYQDPYTGQWVYPQAQPQSPAQSPTPPPQQQYYQQPQQAYDTGQFATGAYDTGQFAAGSYDTGQFAAPVYTEPEPAPAPASAPSPAAAPPRAAVPQQRPAQGGAYQTEQFEFVDDAEESTDVIDWMKFSETRGERRDERRRQIRGRITALVVALTLAIVGGVGYLYFTGKILGSGKGGGASASRQEIVVHLHDTAKHVSTALLISDPATGRTTALLLPDGTGIPSDEGSDSLVALGSSVDDLGNSTVRSGINSLLGSDATATWGLYTPFLQNLVDQIGGITVDANATVTVKGQTLVKPGSQVLSGAGAAAYATYQAAGEKPQARLDRFGQVLGALVKAMPQDASAAASDITKMGAVPDPSLSDATLGAILAAASTEAHKGGFTAQTLPVKTSGGLDTSAAALVQQLFGGKVTQNGDARTVARVSIVNATGDSKKQSLAEAAVTNGGFTLVPGGGSTSSKSTSVVAYADDARAQDAKTLASDLGLPASAVKKVTSAQTVDVVVTLGKDFKGS